MKCDELKSTTAQEIVRNEKDCDYMDELFGGVKMPHTQVYLKSEADKVIAEQEKEARHHKYKRCMAMAKWCKDRIENVVQYNEHDDWLIINEYWERWHNRWIELADKFKEAK